MNPETDKLSLDINTISWEYWEKYSCYCLKNVVYCANPASPDLQSMNLFVPAEYLTADGHIAEHGAKGSYTARTAPIVFSNTIAAYAQGFPGTIGDRGCEEAAQYLEAGMVYVSCGARGKDSMLGESYIGKAPAGLVDLKAGIRFLKHNTGRIPGDTSRIITVGVSAGGAMSALLGVTGNSKNYLPYLLECGAVMDEGDDVYATQAYCPVTDLDHADMAYEWAFQGRYQTDDFMKGSVALTPFQKALSDHLAAAYPTYFNSLALTDPDTGNMLQLDPEGQAGSGYEYLICLLSKAAQKHLTLIQQQSDKVPLQCTLEDYINGHYKRYRRTPKGPMEFPGHDKHSWLSGNEKGVTITSLWAMQDDYLTRMKTCSAFDRLDMDGRNENQVFGHTSLNAVHFSRDLALILPKLQEQYPDEATHYTEVYQQALTDERILRLNHLMNPMAYIGTTEESDIAPNFRIRVGSLDAHTSLTVSMALALKLSQCKKTNVDYAIVWDADHGVCDYPGELCQWIGEITKKEP